MNKKITLLYGYGKTRTYLKRSAVLHHPQIYVVLQLISFSVERAFAGQKKFCIAILLANTQQELKIIKILRNLGHLCILMHFCYIFHCSSIYKKDIQLTPKTKVTNASFLAH